MPKATANNVSIEYEPFGDPSSAPILLIIGLGGQLIYWDDDFCRQLAEAGRYVIRFDNRDAGLSTWGGLGSDRERYHRSHEKDGRLMEPKQRSDVRCRRSAVSGRRSAFNGQRILERLQ